ncbi:MAG: diguanylate cyclase [Epsilonproteobacteria bacterium]|nr:diguanylate cyclase [Campylobacterota bacterium]
MDFSKPIEIAPDIFWVGYVIPDDSFQCHVYLIKNGKESVLIDPGSMITFPTTLNKITSILPINDIKYIILHHQDPDIVGCVATLETIIPRNDKVFITHWRTETLLKHYQWKTPFWLIDQHDWKLTLEGGRELEFIFTPYAHFAGAFCTFDKQTKTLFSSDIFGGLTEEFSLYAKDLSYFESVKLFHIHYMPSKVILNHTLDQIEKVNPNLIAPQHGSIIEKDLISPIIEKMRDLNCGLYMLDERESDIFILNKTDDLMKKFFEDIVSLSSFEMLLRNLFVNISNYIHKLKKMCVYRTVDAGYELYYLVDKKGVRGKKDGIKKPRTDAVSLVKLLVKDGVEIGKVEFYFDNTEKKDKKLVEMFINKILVPFTIGFDKDIRYHDLQVKAIKDVLTGLYNREYMNDALKDKMIEAKKDKKPLSISMVDIDFFKKVNDTLGHLCGDEVLKEISELLLKNLRKSDIVIRYGGEEFLIVMPFTDEKNATLKIDKIRKIVQNKTFCEDKVKITISAGVYQYGGEDDICRFIEKADQRLYKAKQTGRNKVVNL